MSNDVKLMPDTSCKHKTPCGWCELRNIRCVQDVGEVIKVGSPLKVTSDPDLIFDIKDSLTIPKCCVNCSNHPSNGGSGICNCTLPYMENPMMWGTNTTGTTFDANTTYTVQSTALEKDK